jgi:hypothetical protein
VAAVVTPTNSSDSHILPELLAQVEEAIAQGSGDGASDRHTCDEAIGACHAQATIPPQRNAKIWQQGSSLVCVHPTRREEYGGTEQG